MPNEFIYEKFRSKNWWSDEAVLNQPLEYHDEITIKQRRSRYIRTALDYLEQEKGGDAVLELLDALKITLGSSVHQHITNDDNWNSYLLEVRVMMEWIKFFDDDFDHYRLLGYHTISGEFDKKSGLWETLFKIVPVTKILQKIQKNSNMMSQISQASYRITYSREIKKHRSLMLWNYNDLPGYFNRPHPSTVMALTGILQGIFDIKGLLRTGTFKIIGLPFSPHDMPLLEGEKYTIDKKCNIIKEKAQTVGNIKNRIKIGNTKYLHRTACYFVEWNKEDNLFKKLKSVFIQDKVIFDLSKKDDAVQKMIGEHQLQLSRYKEEIAKKTEELRIKNKIIERELDMAADIQGGIVKSKITSWNAISFSSYYQPLEKISGDYYDVFKKSNCVFILMADVSGHGIPAALITMAAKQAFSAHTKPNLTPAEIFSRVNDEIVDRIKTDDYLTAFMLKIDEGNRVVFSNASHNQAIVHRYSPNIFERLDAYGLFIAATKEASNQYETKEIRLMSGDRILLYTDGLTEHTNPKKEQFGEERVLEVLRAMKGEPLDKVKEALVSSLRKFMGKDVVLRDDISLLILELDKNWAQFLKHYNKGINLLKNKEYSQAKVRFEKSFQLIPQLPDTKYMLASTCYGLNKMRDAEKYLREFLEIKSNDPKGLVMMVELMIQKNDLGSAKKNLAILERITHGDRRTEQLSKKIKEKQQPSAAAGVV